MDILEKIGKIFRKKSASTRAELMAAFEKRYASFRELLQANADLAAVFSQLNGAISGERAMETSEVRKSARRACLLAERMSECLNAISGQRYAALAETTRSLGKHIEKELRSHTRGDVNSVTLPLSEVDASMDYIVGGKAANLGELHNMLGLPTPRGFALTIKAGTILLLRNGDLFQKIYAHLSKVDIDRPDTVHNAAEQIGRLIGEARVPRELAEPLVKAWDEAFAPDPKNVVAALRSSAVAEDGVQSFAGQYESVLGVTRPTLMAALKRVVGSLYSERALSYRAAHGYALDATVMGASLPGNGACKSCWCGILPSSCRFADKQHPGRRRMGTGGDGCRWPCFARSVASNKKRPQDCPVRNRAQGNAYCYQTTRQQGSARAGGSAAGSAQCPKLDG